LVSNVAPWAPLLLLLAYPVYALLMASVLAVCGVKRSEIAKWALKQADRQRLADLIRVARGLPSTDDASRPALQDDDSGSKLPSS
jgi:hypothetical protein